MLDQVSAVKIEVDTKVAQLEQRIQGKIEEQAKIIK
jgi:hypothetical protein